MDTSLSHLRFSTNSSLADSLDRCIDMSDPSVNKVINQFYLLDCGLQWPLFPGLYFRSFTNRNRAFENILAHILIDFHKFTVLYVR